MVVESTWHSRDLPVLEALITYFEESSGFLPGPADIAPNTDIDEDQVRRAFGALSGEFVEGDERCILRVLPAGRRAAGQWPSADSWADRIIAGLEAALENETDPVKKTKLKAVVEALGGFGREVLVGVISTTVTQAGGIS